MSVFLRQSTASQSRAIGPFIDDTDFKTPETGLTIANTDIKLVVNGAASANKTSGGGTHRINGIYGITFDATDTATVGEMDVSVVVAGALPVFDKFFVVEEAVYDALFVAGAPGYVTTQIVASVSGAVGSVTGAVGSVTGLTTANVASILALLDDARSEPGQGTPPVNPDLATKIDYIYKFLRNRHTQTSTTLKIYADDATTVDHKATVSDNGTTFDRTEFVAGP